MELDMFGVNFKQVFSLTKLNLRSLPQRLGSSFAAIVGIAGVVAVLVAVLSIGAGFEAVMVQAGDPDVAIILREGSASEMSSSLSREQTRLISEGPGVVTSDGIRAASPELFVVVDLPKRTTGTSANVPLRGVEPGAFLVHEEIEITSGRNFEPGRNELIVGVGAAHAFSGLGLGSKIDIGPEQWTVVGHFSARGSISESELWSDARILQPAFRRGDVYQSVFVRLESEEAFGDFKDALTTDPRLDVTIVRETVHYGRQSQAMDGLVSGLGFLISVLMGLGAIFGAVNTMYNSVSSRTREIATLRALGFKGTPIVLSILAEATALGLIGGLIGGVVAFLGFNGYQTSTMNWQSFSQVTFAFRVTPALVGSGIGYALILGLAAGLLPALRAARMQIAPALRQL